MEDPKNLSNIDKNKDEGSEPIKKKNYLNIILYICLIIFLISGFKLIRYSLDAKANKKLIEKISKSIIVDETIEEVTYENVNEFINKSESTENVETTEVKSRYKIDFDTLREQNADTAGFLKVKGTDIEFVAVQTVDNDYYLKHNFEKNDNRAGWIFVDCRNELDGSDKNIVIYGHNMLNGSMFSTLSNVLEREWLDDINNRFITFITPDENSIYEVYSVYQVADNDYYTQTEFTEESFNNYVNITLKNSIYDFGTTVSSNDQLLTLVTCGRSNSNRIIVNAKKLK